MDTTDGLNSNSSPSLDDQMDMMLMLIQLHEFSASHCTNEVTSFQPLQLSGASTTPTSTHSTMPQAANSIIHNPPMPWSSSFTHLPLTAISFANNPTITTTTPMLQEQDHQTPATKFSNSCPIGSSKIGALSSDKRSSVVAMREMIFQIAVMQPIHIDPESVKAPKRRNVKISKDPQSVAARHRREKISEKIRILQRLVPGGTKMDTASMLDEAIHYVKFLKRQVQSLQRVASNNSGFPMSMSSGGTATATANAYLPLPKPYQAWHFRDA